MTFFLLVVVGTIFGVLLNDQRGRIRRLEDRLDAFARREAVRGPDGVVPEAARPVPPPPVRRPVPASALRAPTKVQVASPTPPAPPAAVPKPTPREASKTFAQNFEALAGGKLPIWIGGIALILAGFYLVRYSVEQGLLGPGARTVLAALFGLILLIGSEAARRIPRFAADPRVGQALAGAGIASLYGTLYMASELFGLIAPLTAFLLMALVTVAALFLSLRHGPPTAIMGLIGGFAAPFLAETAGSLVPLLVYLGLLIAGLFALAIHRGWLWLALAATGGGIAWTIGIMVANLSGLGVAVGVFIVVLALAATQILPKTREVDARLRMLPMLAGFLQLALFAPLVDFAASGWGLYGLMSAASLWLGWRDRRLMPACVAALGLVLILLAGAFFRHSELAPLAALGATILFALPGHALARREGTDRWWTVLALGGTVGPLLVAFATPGHELFSNHGWGWLFAAAALACGLLGWRARGEGRERGMPDWALAGGAVLAAAMALVAALLWFLVLWYAVATLIMALGLAAWARQTGDRFLRYASLGVGGLALLFWLAELALHPEVADSVFGDHPLPAFEPLLALLVIPAAAVAALAWLHRERRADQPLRWTALALALAIPLALVPQDWHPVVLALAMAAALVLPDQGWLPQRALEGLLSALGVALLEPFAPFARIVAESLIGIRLHYEALPAIASLTVALALPAMIAAAGLSRGGARLTKGGRTLAWAGTLTIAAAILYALAKQPLAIATDARFLTFGFVERAVLTQALFAVALLALWRAPVAWRRWALLPLGLGLFRLVWFDALLLNPLLVAQQVGTIPVLNAATLHFGLAAFWLRLAAARTDIARLVLPLRLGSLLLVLTAVVMAVRGAFHGTLLDASGILRAEHYSYSAVFLILSILWLWRGIIGSAGWLRVAGLAVLTLTTFKVFLVDASALEGLLRVLSFLGLGAALIGIGWGYGRFAAGSGKSATEEPAPAA